MNLNFQTTDATNIQAVANSIYAFTNNQIGQLTLPANPNVGDRVQVASGAGGFTIIANNGQSIIDPPSFELTPRGPLAYWRSIACSSDGSKLIAAQQSSGINEDPGYLYTSTDYGVNWIQQTNAGSGYWRCVASSSDGSKLIAAQSSDYIYTSTNYGVNWTQQTNAGSGYWRCVASSSDGSKLVAGQWQDGGGYLYTSTNYGVNWTQQTNAGAGYWVSVASSSDGSKLIAADNNSRSLFTSTNYGVTWTATFNNSDVNYWTGVASSSDGSKLIAVSLDDYRSYISADSGATWTALPKIGGWLCVASSSDGSRLIFGQGYFPGNLFPVNFITQWSTIYVIGTANGSHYIDLVYMGSGLWIPASYTGTFTIQ